MSLPIRALPRVFVPGADVTGTIQLPKEEVEKLRRVLRLSAGAQIAVLPDDGSLVRCEFTGRDAVPIEVFHPQTEAPIQLTIAQSLPKGDKLDEIVRGCTELGVSRFVLFTSDRTVVRWDEKKIEDKLRRLRVIATEACEISFRVKVPTFEVLPDLAAVLKAIPESIVLSEVEGLTNGFRRGRDSETVVVGPEGGWAPKELALIGDRGVTLGPRVLRVDHAAAAAAALLLIPH